MFCEHRGRAPEGLEDELEELSDVEGGGVEGEEVLGEGEEEREGAVHERDEELALVGVLVLVLAGEEAEGEEGAVEARGVLAAHHGEDGGVDVRPVLGVVAGDDALDALGELGAAGRGARAEAVRGRKPHEWEKDWKVSPGRGETRGRKGLERTGGSAGSGRSPRGCWCG